MNRLTCSLSVIFYKVPELLGILVMSGDTKKKACYKLDSFDLRLEPARLHNLMECGGVFPTAFRNANNFCRTGRALADSSKTEQTCSANECNIARAQVCQCVRQYGNLGRSGFAEAG